MLCGRTHHGIVRNGAVSTLATTPQPLNCRDANGLDSSVLGQTPPLVAGDDDCSNTMVWIAYWKSVDHLTAWAHGEVHRAGWDWFNAAKLKHIGLQHETYMVPEGQWESVQHNMRPFGFGEPSLD